MPRPLAGLIDPGRITVVSRDGATVISELPREKIPINAFDMSVAPPLRPPAALTAPLNISFPSLISCSALVRASLCIVLAGVSVGLPPCPSMGSATAAATSSIAQSTHAQNFYVPNWGHGRRKKGT